MTSPSPLLPSSLISKTQTEVMHAIKPVSYYNVKSKYLYDAAKICFDTYNNDIPSKIEELLAFKGVGPKIGYLTFSIAWNKHEGICVDTHVYHIPYTI